MGVLSGESPDQALFKNVKENYHMFVCGLTSKVPNQKTPV